MLLARRTLLLCGLFCLAAAAARAQVPDLSGHWEGSIQTPGVETGLEIDLTKNPAGEMTGTVNIPSQHLKGLPLQNVSLNGNVVGFYARKDQTMAGYLAADGKSISGDYTIEGFTLPFNLLRTGEARIEPGPKSAAISKDLEGNWNGSLDTKAGALRVSLHLTNLADGSAAGHFTVIEQGGLQLPVVITQHDQQVTLESIAVPGRFAGVLNAEGTELAGTWSEGAGSMPLTLRRDRK